MQRRENLVEDTLSTPVNASARTLRGRQVFGQIAPLQPFFTDETPHPKFYVLSTGGFVSAFLAVRLPSHSLSVKLLSTAFILKLIHKVPNGSIQP